jgi:hypothetical protein
LGSNSWPKDRVLEPKSSIAAPQKGAGRSKNSQRTKNPAATNLRTTLPAQRDGQENLPPRPISIF